MLEELKSFNRNTHLFLLSTSIYYLGAGIFFLVFNIYIVEGLHYSKYFLGLLLSASSFSSALFALPAGIIGDRIGRKKCLLTGMTVIALSMALLTHVTSQPVLVAANGLLGFGNTMAYVSFAPFMMENTSPRERVHLFSVNGALLTAGYTAGAYMGGELPSILSLPYPEQLHSTLLIAVVFSVCAIFPLLWLTEKKKSSGGPLFSRQTIKSTSLMGKFLFNQIIVGVGAGLIVPFFNIFFVTQFDLSMNLVGVIFALGNIATGIATFLAASVASRFGKVRSIVTTQVLSLPFLLMIAYSNRIPLAATGFIARSALMNMGGPIASAFMMETVQEEERATINGIVSAGWHGSWAMSNIIAGALMDRGFYHVPFLITCCLYGISSGLYYHFFASLDTPEGPIRVQHPLSKKF
ncbi:MAG: MFS transporter [Theionarchaea archaeon]|nr:MFS transporter [Theionarchaea archaeon]